MKNIFLIHFLVYIWIAGGCSLSNSAITVQVESTAVTGENIPVHTEIDLPYQFQNTSPDEIGVTLQAADGSVSDVPGQITREDDGRYLVWWIVPESNTDQPSEWEVTLHQKSEGKRPEFEWQDDKGKHLDLLIDDHKVFRYEYELDSQFVLGETLTAKNRVFYHLYDLAGQRFITNGYEEGTWSHHRGIMIGWRDVMYDGQKLSFWGMEQLTTQEHIAFTELTAGPVLARVKSRIHWKDSTGNTIIEEIRTATIYHQPEPVIALLDFSSDLKAVSGDVSLAGDAEHGGVQYRAHDDVAAEKPGSKKPTYYFHKDGIDPKVDHNLPWVGMAYDLDHKTYSVVEMSGEGNPQPAVWSAYRDYGRFGPYLSRSLAEGESFEVNFRFFISESEMPSREEIDAVHALYLNPPEVSVE